MRLMGTAEDPTDSLGQLIGAEQPIGLNDLAPSVDPHRLDRVEPRALLGQKYTTILTPSLVALILRLCSSIRPLTNGLVCQLAFSQINTKAGFAHSREFVAPPSEKHPGEAMFQTGSQAFELGDSSQENLPKKLGKHSLPPGKPSQP